MEPTHEELEALLRKAPAPRPPAGLKSKLLRTLRAEESQPTAVGGRDRRGFSASLTGGGWRRWIVLLLPAGVAAALGTAAWVRQDRIREVTADLQQLKASGQSPSGTAGVDAGNSSPSAALSPPDERADIARLRELLARLEKDVATVARLEAENLRLKADIATLKASLPPEFKELAEAGDRANSIRCVNNLKQMGLAVRVWANDNEGEYPPDVLSMTNELTTPKILVCPSDSGRSTAETWAEYSTANLSYELLSPGPGKFETEPTRVLFRCPVHGHVGLCDGSVQMGVAKEHPDWFVSRHGGLYMESRPEPRANANAGARGGAAVSQQASGPRFQMSPELARRYGLVPVDPSGAPIQDGFGGSAGEVVTGTPVTRVDADNGNVIGSDDPGVFFFETGDEPVEAGEEPQP
ncbi:MAG: hypothetical protein AB7O66_01820 [Limisphaerales bacterium]